MPGPSLVHILALCKSLPCGTMLLSGSSTVAFSMGSVADLASLRHHRTEAQEEPSPSAKVQLEAPGLFPRFFLAKTKKHTVVVAAAKMSAMGSATNTPKSLSPKNRGKM